MRWSRSSSRSRHLEDRRGSPGAGGMGGMRGMGMGGKIGLPMLLVLVVTMFLGGRNVIGGDGGSGFGIDTGFDSLPTAPAAGSGSAIPRSSDEDAELVDFVSFVLDDVQATWTELFREGNRTYEPAELVLFEGSTSTACGVGQEASGPFYCPLDEKAYVDLDFFRELHSRFGAPGDFAQAYVIAHELGHHVQKLLGVNAKVRREQQRRPDDANELSVRQELQADCLAGVWAHSTYERGVLDDGDLREGIDAAASVGDDRLQRQAGARVNPESWTHGSSDQRVAWFRTGYESGNPDSCDTFSGSI